MGRCRSAQCGAFNFFLKVLSLLPCLGSQLSGKITTAGFLVLTEGTQPKAQGTAPHSVPQGVRAQSPYHGPPPAHPTREDLGTTLLLRPFCSLLSSWALSLFKGPGVPQFQSPVVRGLCSHRFRAGDQRGCPQPCPSSHQPTNFRTKNAQTDEKNTPVSLGEFQQCGL